MLQPSPESGRTDAFDGLMGSSIFPGVMGGKEPPGTSSTISGSNAFLFDLEREARAVRVAAMLADGGADGVSLVASLLADAATVSR